MDVRHAESGHVERGVRAPSAARRRDRRHGLSDVLVTLSRLVGGRDAASLRGAFEETLRQGGRRHEKHDAKHLVSSRDQSNMMQLNPVSERFYSTTLRPDCVENLR